MLYNFIDKFFMNDFSNEIINYIKNIKKKKITVFDIGSYKGNFSRKIKKKLKSINKISDFYLFDPNPDLSLKDFKYYKIALSNKKERKRFFLNNFLPSSGSSISNLVFKDKIWNISRKIFSFNFKKKFSKVTVQSDTIDNFCKKKNIKSIDLLKIDVEGTEYNVLEGAKNILEHTKILQIEIFEKKNKFQKKLSFIIKVLSDNYNFKLIKKKTILSTQFLSSLKGVDLLFTKRSLKKKI